MESISFNLSRLNLMSMSSTSFICLWLWQTNCQCVQISLQCVFSHTCGCDTQWQHSSRPMGLGEEVRWIQQQLHQFLGTNCWLLCQHGQTGLRPVDCSMLLRQNVHLEHHWCWKVGLCTTRLMGFFGWSCCVAVSDISNCPNAASPTSAGLPRHT